MTFAHAEVIEEGIEQQGGGARACSNYKAGKVGGEHKQKLKWGYFDFLRGLSCRSRRDNNNTGGEVVAEAIDIVAATRADRIWIAWSESCNSLRTTEIPGTAPTSPFEDGQEEEQQWYAEVIPDEIQPVSVLGDGIGQHQQQECNDGEIPDMTFPASPSEVRD